MGSWCVLDIKKGMVDKSKVILAEFDSEKEAIEWQRKIKGEDIHTIVDYPVFYIKGEGEQNG